MSLPTKPRSLRATLARSILVPLLLFVLLAAYLQSALVLQPTIEAFDHALGDDVLVLSRLVHASAGGVQVEVDPQTEQALRTDRTDRVSYVVLDPSGRMVAGDAPLAALAFAGAAGEQITFADASLDAARVRVARLAVPCQGASCEVRVAETLNKRQRAQRDAIVAVLLPMALLTVALLVAVMTAIGRGLRPLDALRAQLTQRSLQRLDPVDEQPVFAEAQPMVAAVNNLLARLRAAADSQKHFIADAAHQLRTPLTALRTESELALLEPHPESVRPTLLRLAHASERAARLATQLLALARAESADTEPPQALDLKALVADAADEWIAQASRRGADLGFELESVCVMGRAVLLRELVGNLLHNALEYGGEGVHVTVRTHALAATAEAVIEVEDNGPGIAPEDRDRVFRRFDRGSRPVGNGSGLGLCIVRDIAATHGGRSELLNRAAGGGICVRVRLPLFDGARDPRDVQTRNAHQRPST